MRAQVREELEARIGLAGAGAGEAMAGAGSCLGAEAVSTACDACAAKVASRAKQHPKACARLPAPAAAPVQQLPCSVLSFLLLSGEAAAGRLRSLMPARCALCVFLLLLLMPAARTIYPWCWCCCHSNYRGASTRPGQSPPSVLY